MCHCILDDYFHNLCRGIGGSKYKHLYFGYLLKWVSYYFKLWYTMKGQNAVEIGPCIAGNSLISIILKESIC